jgi:hypothetical protein
MQSADHNSVFASGMRLNHLKSKLRILSSLEDTPDVIVLHVAGNDLGAYEIGDLRYHEIDSKSLRVAMLV